MPYIGNVTTSSNVNGSQINNGTITGDKLSLPFDYDSATLYLDNTNNRVGILTASPSSTLTVGTGGVVSIPLASAATPSLVFGTDTNTGIYSPGADQVAISTNGVARLTTSTTAVSSSLAIDVPLGAVGTPSITFTGDLNTGIYSPAADTLAFVEGGVEALRIDSSGRVGIGTTAPSELLHVAGNARVGANDTSVAELQVGAGATGNRTSVIDLVGDTTYNDFGLRLERGGTGANTSSVIQHRGTGEFRLITNEASPLVFWTQSTERARIDSSGRLLVGTSTAPNVLGTQSKFNLAVGDEGAAVIGRWSSNQYGPVLVLAKSRSTSIGTSTIVQNGDSLGFIYFAGADGVDLDSSAALIEAQVDGTPGANDMPGRLVFSTTADGSASPTERFRIGSAGQLGIGGATYGTSGQVLTSQGSGTAPVWASPGGGFASGTAMLFVQTAAPTGWTKSTTHDNKALRVVSGTASSGGSAAFTTAFASRTPAGTVGNTTLTTAQMPSHSHTYPGGGPGGDGGGAYDDDNCYNKSTGGAGSNSAHNHGFTGTAMDFAVAYVDVIIATKD